MQDCFLNSGVDNSPYLMKLEIRGIQGIKHEDKFENDNFDGGHVFWFKSSGPPRSGRPFMARCSLSRKRGS